MDQYYYLKPEPGIRGKYAYLCRLLIIALLSIMLGACATTAKHAGDSGSILVGARDDIAIDPGVARDFNTALSLLKKEKYEQAIELLESIVKRENRVTAPYVNLGIAYMRVGEMGKAENNLKKAVELDPGHPIANNELGLLYRRTGRFSQARNVYERTLKKYPDFLPVRKNLAILCDIYLDDLDCALNNFEKLAEALPEDQQLKIWIAEVKNRKGR
ncbi:MAG: tetratricopeptide repeat protein [Thiohalophilus sp.]|jgi:tetratricopeptide (TPR) repeat protein